MKRKPLHDIPVVAEDLRQLRSRITELSDRLDVLVERVEMPVTLDRLASSKDLLRRILTTSCGGCVDENLPFSNEEQQWAIEICLCRPDWSVQTLRACGIEG
tara:strand:+ start:16965 stop:17270 length:306 start_codon:yes stop_codon:yes gene_type:complete